MRPRQELQALPQQGIQPNYLIIGSVLLFAIREFTTKRIHLEERQKFANNPNLIKGSNYYQTLYADYAMIGLLVAFMGGYHLYRYANRHPFWQQQRAPQPINPENLLRRRPENQ